MHQVPTNATAHYCEEAYEVETHALPRQMRTKVPTPTGLIHRTGEQLARVWQALTPQTKPKGIRLAETRTSDA